MATRRQQRINTLLFEQLSLLVPAEASDDPRLTNVIVTKVESTQDLATAKVFFIADGDDAETAEALEALKASEGVLRSELANLGLRRLPRLVFARDRDYESGERVLEILNQLNLEQAGSEQAAEPADPGAETAEPVEPADSP